MISTPLEEKFRAFLLAHQDGTSGTEISFISKIYTDQPRQDISRAAFPRLRVAELASPSTVVHRTSTREYDANVSILIFVDMDTPLTIDSSAASPEVACSRIGYKIIDLINDSWETGLFTGEHFYVRTLTYNKMGVDNTYFNNLNVYKGSVEVNGIYWR